MSGPPARAIEIRKHGLHVLSFVFFGGLMQVLLFVSIIWDYARNGVSTADALRTLLPPGPFVAGEISVSIALLGMFYARVRLAGWRLEEGRLFEISWRAATRSIDAAAIHSVRVRGVLVTGDRHNPSHRDYWYELCDAHGKPVAALADLTFWPDDVLKLIRGLQAAQPALQISGGVLEHLATAVQRERERGRQAAAAE